MTDWVTFEEMEEGVEHVARDKHSGRLYGWHYKKSAGDLLIENIDGFWKSTVEDERLVFSPIPVYKPAPVWEPYLDAQGDFKIVDDVGDMWSYYPKRSTRKASNDCLKAAIAWLQDELDSRQKAGKS